MSYTPSPWEFPNGLGIKASGQPLQVAGRTKRAIANRAVIASAPDMLEALEKIQGLVNSGESDPEEMAKILTQIGPITDAAIAKAKAKS